MRIEKVPMLSRNKIKCIIFLNIRDFFVHKLLN